MKTNKKQPSVNPEPVPAGLTSRQVKSLEDITTEFLLNEKQKKTNQGENSYVDDVGIALKMLCHSYQYQSWSLQDAASLLSHLDVSVADIAPIFNAWCDELQKHGRLQTLLSIYAAYPTYAFQ